MTTYEKCYPAPDTLLYMHYFKASDPSRRVLYEREWHQAEYRKARGEELKEDPGNYNSAVGFYCLKCREFHEFDHSYYYENEGDIDVCSCGKNPAHDICINTNGGVSRGRARPHRLSITHKDTKIRVTVTFRDWHINAKAMKPYFQSFAITVIINTETKQSYWLPATWKGKTLFTSDGVRNIGFSDPENNYELNIVNKVFKNDPEAMAALLMAYVEHVPELDSALTELRQLIDWNHLRGLYKLFPGYDEGNYWSRYDEILAWRTLRRRYTKDPTTFPAYLYHGCSKVATKSIKRVLYKYPEQKWTLKFLYKDLKVSNVDLLRQYLSERRSYTAKLALYMFFSASNEERNGIQTISEACDAAGLTDREKLSFFFRDETDLTIIGDTVRLMSLHGLPEQDLRTIGSIRALHDLLTEINMRDRNKALWERYSKPQTYGDKINAMEGEWDGADFRIVRTPWDLKALGRKYHNCVGTYMDEVASGRSIIIEMELDSRPVACIELDGTGKYCYQAYAPCNMPLDENVADIFGDWTEKNHIQTGQRRPMRFYDNPAYFEPMDDIPF